jgi:hypothetical protein
MPFFFTCEQCQAAVKPLPDNCYVFGSYGSVPYPSQQVWRPSVCHADASVGTVHRHHAPEWQNILRIRVPEILPKDKHRVWVVHRNLVRKFSVSGLSQLQAFGLATTMAGNWASSPRSPTLRSIRSTSSDEGIFSDVSRIRTHPA